MFRKRQIDKWHVKSVINEENHEPKAAICNCIYILVFINSKIAWIKWFELLHEGEIYFQSADTVRQNVTLKAFNGHKVQERIKAHRTWI